MSAAACIQSLLELGFSKLEAEIYVYLLQHSPVTGYRIAKEIGKVKSNVYEALSSLELRGAVYVEDGASRLWRAVPPDSMTEQMNQRFQENRTRLVDLARELEKRDEVLHDDRVYSLSTLEQVFERSRKMLRACREVALLELDPGPLDALRHEVEATASRGVKISLRIYRPDTVKGVRLLLSTYKEEAEARSKVQWMCICTDGKQYLSAYVEPRSRTIHQAVWSASPILSAEHFSLLNAEFIYYSLRPILESADSLEEVRTAYQELEAAFPMGDYPGYREIRKRFGWK